MAYYVGHSERNQCGGTDDATQPSRQARAAGARASVAPTTVSTILRRLEDKGLVAHRAEDRRFLFRPLVERRDLRRSMVGDLVDQLFGGSTSELLSHLVDEGKIDPAALERLRKVIAARKGEKGRRRGS
jgi:predicted transcriptional regulator